MFRKLDFEKIYDLLQYEIVTPFVGGGGSHRDQFTYGLIKLLELHFNTRLGFHEKLNKNQKQYLNDALMTSIAGISAAMKNTG